ncbi:MAG: U32 family peptidase, partial [Syntrophomonas sp.]|nr:U32 family peptidase [Syntrophomonas sp.]
MPGNYVELLAPAGRWDVLEQVAAAGADAVYLGGKRFNMRMLKQDYNFSDQELRNAVDFLHQQNKKIYITLNNLYYDAELNELQDYLFFLQDIAADALIIQDMAVLALCRELKLKLPLHASVQMGIANLQAAHFLEDQGFDRAILAKNLTLDEIKEIHDGSKLALEFFAFGDLCIAHAGQCYMSSLVAGESGNRGRCLKPCRWPYRLEGAGQSELTAYYLAHNDLCLYPQLPALLAAGVSSLKIEGRMRSAEYLAHIIGIYRQALDRLTEDPEAYEMNTEDYQKLTEKRVRDFCNGNLFGRAGIESIGLSGEKEPFFPTRALKLKKLRENEVPEEPEFGLPRQQPCWSVKIGDMESLEAMAGLGVKRVILEYAAENRVPSGWRPEAIRAALSLQLDRTQIWVETPRIVSQSEFRKMEEDLRIISHLSGLGGFIVNEPGSFSLLRCLGQAVWGGHGLNTNNYQAAIFWRKQGMSGISASLELEWSRVKSLLSQVEETELLVHGPLAGIITDLCLPRG